MANNKINKIQMPVGGTLTILAIEDANAVHTVKTINGEAITGSTANLELANTPIPAATITALFNE